MKTRLLVNAIFLFLAFYSSNSFSKASLFLTEDVLFLTADAPVASVSIVNRGTKTGVFAVRWLDHTMRENGTLQRLQTGKPEHSLAPKIRFSPRRVTLAPGQSQQVKIALKRKAIAAPEREYYSHLHVQTINDDLESTIERHGQKIEPGEAMQVKAKIGISIPVIWRHKLSPASPSLSLIKETEDKVRLTVRKIGMASLRGYLHIANAKTNLTIADPYPIVIYPNLSQRDIELEVPAFMHENLMVIFSEDNKLTDAPISSIAKATLL